MKCRQWRWMAVLLVVSAARADLHVTEVMSKSISTNPAALVDWFELYNSGPGAVDLSAYSWDDNSAAPGSCGFNNYVLPAGACYIITQGATNQEAAFRAAWELPAPVAVWNAGNAAFQNFSSGGDQVHVFNGGGSNVAGVSFGAATDGVAFQWSRQGVYLGLSVTGQYGAWQMPGGDVGSPGTNVSMLVEDTHVIAYQPPSPATCAPNAAVVFQSRSTSNGVAEVGIGRTATGAGWSWFPVPVSNTPSGYLAQTSMPVTAPGIFYSAARWTYGTKTYYGWNGGGQTNELLVQGQYRVMVTNGVLAPWGGALLITEVMAASSETNGASNGDWFELYYRGTEPVTLLGCSFNDSTLTPGLNVFSNLTLLPEQVIVVLDEAPDHVAPFTTVWAPPAGTRVVSKDELLAGGFPGLSSNGDGLRVFDPFNEQIASVYFSTSVFGHSFAWTSQEDQSGAPLPPDEVSSAGLNGAWQAPHGTDVGSPGVVVPEAGALALLWPCLCAGWRRHGEVGRAGPCAPRKSVVRA